MEQYRQDIPIAVGKHPIGQPLQSFSQPLSEFIRSEDLPGMKKDADENAQRRIIINDLIGEGKLKTEEGFWDLVKKELEAWRQTNMPP